MYGPLFYLEKYLVRTKGAVMIKKIKFLEMYYVFLSMFDHVP